MSTLTTQEKAALQALEVAANNERKEFDAVDALAKIRGVTVEALLAGTVQKDTARNVSAGKKAATIEEFTKDQRSQFQERGYCYTADGSKIFVNKNNRDALSRGLDVLSDAERGCSVNVIDPGTGDVTIFTKYGDLSQYMEPKPLLTDKKAAVTAVEQGKSEQGANTTSLNDSVVNVLDKVATYTGAAGDISDSLSKTDLVDAPVLNSFSSNMKILGNAITVIDVANTTYNHMKICNEGKESFWQGSYNIITSGLSIMGGAAVGGAVTGAGALGSYGTMTVPSVAAGIAAGSAASTIIDCFFDGIEKKIWGVAH